MLEEIARTVFLSLPAEILPLTRVFSGCLSVFPSHSPHRPKFLLQAVQG